MNFMRPNIDLASADRAHLLHPFTSLNAHQVSGPWMLERASGISVTDTGGVEYIDAVSGLACVHVGYGRTEIADAIYAQTCRLPYSPLFWSMSNEPAAELASRLVDLAPGRMKGVFFGTSGSDANDTQIKLVRYYNYMRGKPQKTKIIARNRAYHGTTLATSSLTGQSPVHKALGLPLPGFLHVREPDFGRYGEPSMTERDFAAALGREIEELIENEGPETVGAFIAEPIMGASGGVLVPPEGYWDEIKRIVAKYDMLMIADEVICGFGRTGKMFACEHFDLQPDLLTVSKGLTSGYLPMSAAIVSEKVMSVLEDASAAYGPLGHGYTNTGHPVLAAAALANLNIIEREGLVENAAAMGAYLKAGLEVLFDGQPEIRNIRGKGLLIGLEFVGGEEASEASQPVRFMLECRAERLFVRAAPGNATVGLSPPLTLTTSDIDEILARMSRAFARSRAS